MNNIDSKRGPPDFIVIGAQKCGTTACARNLALHPDIEVFAGTTEYGQMEIEFFNQHWDRGPVWYYSHFERRKALCGEKTAELFHRTICHARMRHAAPRAKLILLLRDPVERAWSQWKMAVTSKRDEPRSFEDVIQQEYEQLSDISQQRAFDECASSDVSNWRQGYLQRGFYARQLKHLLNFYPKSSLHIAISERVKEDMRREYGRMHEFLHLPALENRFANHYASRDTTNLPPKMAEFLQRIYADSLEELEALIGFDIHEWRRK